MIHLLQVTIPTHFPEIEMKKTLLIITTLVVVQITLGCCGGSDEVDESKRQYDEYMWMMMMNGGPQVTGLSPWLLLCLGVGATLFSSDVRGVARLMNSKDQ